MEAIAGATANLEIMVKRVLGMGIEADSLLMDRWFSFPSLLATLGALFFACCAEYADLTLVGALLLKYCIPAAICVQITTYYQFVIASQKLKKRGGVHEDR